MSMASHNLNKFDSNNMQVGFVNDSSADNKYGIDNDVTNFRNMDSKVESGSKIQEKSNRESQISGLKN